MDEIEAEERAAENAQLGAEALEALVDAEADNKDKRQQFKK